MTNLDTMGFEGTTNKIISRYYWPEMKRNSTAVNSRIPQTQNLQNNYQSTDVETIDHNKTEINNITKTEVI